MGNRLKRGKFVPLLFVAILAACGGGSQSKDPTVPDFPLAFVSRPIPVDDDGNPRQNDLRRPDEFNPGATLMLMERAAVGAALRDISSSAFGAGALYDVKDVEANYNGTKLVFAMRAPEIENAAAEDQPAWNIWEYDLADDRLIQLTSSNNPSQGHNVAPHYLPDGKIVYSSSQQIRSKAILVDDLKSLYAALDEDRRTHAFVLQVMDADGRNVEQITFNQSHDLDPTVLNSGKILFSRWDGAGRNSEINLYTVWPDGTDLELYYGSHSHQTGTNDSTIQFAQPREMPNGQILSLIRPYTNTHLGGLPIAIDATNYTDEFQLNRVGTVVNSAQSTVIVGDLRSDDEPSPDGRYSSVFPVWDGTNELLVSWSPCHITDNGSVVPCPDPIPAGSVEAEPRYGLWRYDPLSSTPTHRPLILAQSGIVYTDIVAANPRTIPLAQADIADDNPINVTLRDEEKVGVLNIRSVYDIGGVFNDRDAGTPDKTLAALADPVQTAADARSARFVRVVKAVSMPDDNERDFNNSAFGPQLNQFMREIVAYAPVEPDGSVKLKVPADVALAVDILDSNGRRIGGRHENWIQVRPGETRTCNGCHTAGSEVPHSRPDAEFPSLNPGAPFSGYTFPNTLISASEAGQTMAEALVAHLENVRLDSDPPIFAITPSADLVYTDVWTNATPTTVLSYTYGDLTTKAPNDQCSGAWSSLCRIIINYETHIHPIWSVVRPNPADTCTACHSPVDAMANPRVPLGQLDLTDDGPNDNDDRFRAYRELLIVNNAQALDPMTNQLVAAGTVPVTMSANGANSSNAFFNLFASGGTHEGRLTPHELRLLSEWLDIGAQYYNNPFQAPTN